MKISEDWANHMNFPYACHDVQSPMDASYCDNYGDFGHYPYACQGTQEQVAAFQSYNNYYSAYEQPYHHYNNPPPVYADPTPTPPPDMQDLRNMLIEIQKNQEHLIAQFEQQITQLAVPQVFKQPDQLPSQPANPHHNMHPAYSIQLRSSTVCDYPQMPNAEYEVEDIANEDELYGAEDAIGEVNPEAKIDEFTQKPVKLGPHRSVDVVTDRPHTLSGDVEQKIEEKVVGWATSLNVNRSDALMSFDSCAGESVSFDLVSRFEDVKEPADNKKMDSVPDTGPIGGAVNRSVDGHSAQDFKDAREEVLSLDMSASVAESVHDMRTRKFIRYAYKEIYTEFGD